MAIFDCDGTANHEIGTIYDNDGTANHQINTIYDNDGAANYLSYSAEEQVFPNTSYAWNGFISGGSHAGYSVNSTSARLETVWWNEDLRCGMETYANLTGYNTVYVTFTASGYNGNGDCFNYWRINATASQTDYESGYTQAFFNTNGTVTVSKDISALNGYLWLKFMMVTGHSNAAWIINSIVLK